MVLFERVGGKYSCPLFGELSTNEPSVDHAEDKMLVTQCPHHHDDHLLNQLFITQTSVSVMASPGQQQQQQQHQQQQAKIILVKNIFNCKHFQFRHGGSRCSIKYEPEPNCPSPCDKSNTEKVVVALLMGALIIIFLTLALSLVYLRESQQQHQSLIQYTSGDRTLTQAMILH